MKKTKQEIINDIYLLKKTLIDKYKDDDILLSINKITDPQIMLSMFVESEILRSMCISDEKYAILKKQKDDNNIVIDIVYDLKISVLERFNQKKEGVKALQEIMKTIDELGVDKQYLKGVYFSVVNSKIDISHDSYMNFLEQVFKAYKENYSILNIGNKNISLNNNNLSRIINFFGKDKDETNFLLSYTTSINMDKNFYKEFSLKFKFLEEMVDIFENNKKLTINEENKEYEMGIYKRKMRRFSECFCGFDKVEAKVMKTKYLSLEEKDTVLNKLYSFYGYSFTEKVKDNGSFEIINSDYKINNEVILLLNFKTSQINSSITEFLLNSERNLDKKKLKGENYDILIRRVNKNSLIFGVTDNSLNKIYMNNKQAVLEVINNNVQKLLEIFSEHQKTISGMRYVSKSKKLNKTLFETNSFLDILHAEIRKIKLIDVLENNKNEKKNIIKRKKI